MVTENKELTEELKDKELWELSNPSERILFKSKYLLISNLTKRMTETQNILGRWFWRTNTCLGTTCSTRC